MQTNRNHWLLHLSFQNSLQNYASFYCYDVILFFSRNGFVSGTQADVDKRMKRTGIKIYLFDDKDIDKLVENPQNLSELMRLKTQHIEEVFEGIDPVVDGLASLPKFQDKFLEKGWTPPNENTDKHSEPETNS